MWTNDGQSNWFKVLSSVHKGCILSPILFTIAIDWVLKEAMSNKGIKLQMSVKLSDLDFADNNATLSNSTHDLQIVRAE